MASFEGYLFKSDGEEFPIEYIEYDTYSTLPNSREEIKAYRDDNTRDLTRVTSEGHKSSFSFSVRSGLKLADIQKIKTFFSNHFVNELERKLYITYWNNEDLEYHSNYFYVADIKYKIRSIFKQGVNSDTNDIMFDSFEISFVEY